MNSLLILCEFVKEKKPSSKFFNKFIPIPQIIHNLKGLDKEILNRIEVKEKLHKIKKKIENNARIVIRPSGTEKIIRIMVESNDQNLILSTVKEVEKILL